MYLTHCNLTKPYFPLTAMQRYMTELLKIVRGLQVECQASSPSFCVMISILIRPRLLDPSVLPVDPKTIFGVQRLLRKRNGRD